MPMITEVIMKKTGRMFLVTTLLLSSVAGLWAATAAPLATEAWPSLTLLTRAEKARLVFLREEEKLARDVYIKMYERWGASVFSNISVSEQRHMDSLLMLLNKYGISDPAAGKAAGEFTNPDLQALYTRLVAKGGQSVRDAYSVGRAIERLDIADLKDALAETAKPDLDRVYANLLRGSENHLRAFSSKL